MRSSSLIIAGLSAAIWLTVSGCSADTGEPVKVEMTGPAEPVTEVGETGPSDCMVAPPAEPVACTMQYDPVCGCDGKTYGNACMAHGAGVPHSKPGACDDNPND